MSLACGQKGRISQAERTFSVNTRRWENNQIYLGALSPGRIGNDEGPVHEIQVIQDVADLVDSVLILEPSLFYGNTFWF